MHYSRVAACIPELLQLDLDARSTSAYGLTHLMCALTVTNRELRAKALAEKDITPEQFEQVAELQRIKTKDEQGNVIEEKKVNGSEIWIFDAVVVVVNMYHIGVSEQSLDVILVPLLNH